MQRDRKRVILRQRVRDLVRAVRAVRNTQVFQTETRVVTDALLVVIGTERRIQFRILQSIVKRSFNCKDFSISACSFFCSYISKMYFSHCKHAEVSKRMCSVNLDASISGEY
jgi:hypothetical protein